MSFLTRCCLWKKWNTILSSPGRIKFSGIQKSIIFSKLNGIDGKPMDFEWKIFPRFTTAGIPNEFQKMMVELQCDPANFKGMIIFMSMFNDIVWDAKGNEELCENRSKRVQEYARRFPRCHWSYLGLGSEKKWYATYNCKPNGSWDRTAEKRCKISKDLITLYSVVQDTFFLKKKKAKEEEGQPYTSKLK